MIRGWPVRTRRSRSWCRWLLGCLAVAGPAVARAAEPAAPPPDPLAQAVIDSLASTPRTKPAEILDAAVRAADVEAFDIASRSLAQLGDLLEKAGDDAPTLLADLGDAADPADLRRLERALGGRDPAAIPLLRAMQSESARRLHDPDRIRQDAAALANESASVREAAADRLARAGVAALPALVDVLQDDSPAAARSRGLARWVVRELGTHARQPLLAWLGSDDIRHWPGVIEALAAGVAPLDDADAAPPDFAEHLLAPALVPGTPPAARDRAVALLRRLAIGRDAAALPPDPETAIALLTRRLDRVLSVDGLPAPDHLLLEPVLDPAAASAASGVTVERHVWNPQAGQLQRLDVPPHVARAMEAQHLARDLAALEASQPEAVRLILLARVEALLAAAGDPLTALDRIPTSQLRAALSGPTGFDIDAVADVLELAASRGMTAAATAAARTLAAAAPAADETEASAPLPPQTRAKLLRALVVPDAALQFECARTLALAAGDPPYRGSSRVVEMLTHAATATGEDVAIVAHPDAVVRESLATGLSRFGYRVEQVATGREAILAARADIDTVLVLLAARSAPPSALETVQLIQRQPVGDVPPVLVIVDPLDDDARGCYLTQLLLKFADFDCVGITDRLDSLFLPRIDPETGREAGPPRFSDRLATVAGPLAVDPRARQLRAAQRRARASQALALLADLGRRGWDVSAAETTARLALMAPGMAPPQDLFTPALSLLSTLGSVQAQQAVLREAERSDLPDDTRRLALAGFASSVERHGILLESGPLRAAYAMYNRATTPADRDVAAAILDVLETPLRKACPAPVDAARPRPQR